MNENRKNLTVENIRSKFPKEKENFEKYNLWVNLVVRPSSYYLTWLFIRLGVSANQITYLSLTIGTIGCMLLASGTYKVMITGALLINFYDLLDSVDGNIARYTNTCSKYGGFLDGVVDTTMSVFVFTCAGIGAFHHPDLWLNSATHVLDVNIGKNVFLFLGTWASVCYIYPRLIGYILQKTFLEKKFVGREDVIGSPSRFVNIITTNLYNITGLVMPMLLIAVLFNFLGIFVLLFTLINTSAFVVSLILLLRKARANNG